MTTITLSGHDLRAILQGLAYLYIDRKYPVYMQVHERVEQAIAESCRCICTECADDGRHANCAHGSYACPSHPMHSVMTCIRCSETGTVMYRIDGDGPVCDNCRRAMGVHLGGPNVVRA